MTRKSKTQIKNIHPLCSIIVPTYNREDFLPICLKSVIAQKYQNWECIVVNDAGKDVSHVVESFHDKRIKYIVNEKNMGLGATRNEGLKIAQGEYVNYCDDDDFLTPYFLQIMLQEIQNCDYPLIYGDVVRQIIQKNEQGVYVTIGRDIPYSVDWDHDLLLIQNITPVTGIFMKRKILDIVGYFDPTLKRYEDYDLLIRVSIKYGMKHIPMPVAYFTARNDTLGGSMSSTPDNLFSTQLPLIYERYWKYAKNQMYVCSAMNQVLQARGLQPMFNIQKGQ